MKPPPTLAGSRLFEEMLHFVAAFSRCPVPRGNRVAVLTNAGGPAIMATDTLLAAGMQMATLAPEKLAVSVAWPAADAKIRSRACSCSRVR